MWTVYRPEGVQVDWVLGSLGLNVRVSVTMRWMLLQHDCRRLEAERRDSTTGYGEGEGVAMS
ncbi:hypothetical protein JMJ77_0010881 [Colletotrichum scovillei]|uniref:Uncharacterized protein n=1 Tax=Colletotrichum scovillei TaxID=1209932 RepID=A0A9P7R2E6_9PEZI|nr:hypothetical protein JMJ77_0010881 [Colletotrichum scovillei]KAG7059850.1 hypothetical protein JMJ78_0015136 [Colletotrichum scovillei]KAG7067297.1 hypothetical protein JMJ76_0008737 [Colletotrichum scovillei]